MSYYPSEKRDSFTDANYPTKEAGYDVTSIHNTIPSRSSHASNIDTTRPQVYELKNIKTDWVFKGAYSLRLSRDDPSTEAWNVKISSKALEIFRADGTLVGTAGLHSMSSKVDVSLHNSRSIPEFQMKRKGFCCMLSKKIFSLNGQEYYWKSASKMGFKHRLHDQNGEAVAWAGSTSWKGRYNFELIKPGLDLETVEAVLITGLAVLENEKRETWAASTSASNSAGASVAVSA
jgi:hypothetical protein